NLAEAEGTRPAAKNDLVAVLEKRPLAPVGEPERSLAVPGELDQTSLRPALRAGDRPRGEQISGADARSVHGRVRELLRHRPVQPSGARARDHLAVQLDLEVDVEVPLAVDSKVRQRSRILHGPRHPRPVKRIERRYPGRDRRRERLAEERTERLVLPG